jgi:RHS repeat-associated protein
MNLRDRFVSALTLFSFTVTTVSPSLAWAAEREEIRHPARFVDEVESSDLQTPKEAVEPGQAADELTVPKERPDTDELQKAVTTNPVKKPAADTQVETDATQTAALPTGADKSGVTSQAISVPKGSGTIQGMGESFSAQLSTGIATFSVPFALPAARGGAQPSLGLSYSSASGAGLAGMGWSVGVPFIARQTDRGLPGYEDHAEWRATQDRFVFNGGQELVPICLVQSATSCIDPFDPKKEEKLLPGEQMPGWAAGSQYFRPRVEGSFLRFFWSKDHKTWRVQDKSGVTMELGVPLDGSDRRDGLEINPDPNPKGLAKGDEIYRWHLVRQYDTYGDANPAVGNPAPVNVVVYRYRQDGNQAYLSDIYDTTPATAPTTTDVTKYAHHTHLEYQDRSDPTESYRSGWLMKQRLRLARVDVTSKTLAGAAAARRLVRRYHLTYDDDYHTSLLTSVQVEGRCEGAETSAPAETNELLGATSCARLPAMEFEYGHVKGFNTAGTSVGSGLAGYDAFDQRVQQIGTSPDYSVDSDLADFFDVNADGLPDLLVTAPAKFDDDFAAYVSSGRFFASTATHMPVLGVNNESAKSLLLRNENVVPLDIDGDGLSDLVHINQARDTYSVYSAERQGSALSWRGRAVVPVSGRNPKIDLSSSGFLGAETRIADVNFDGLVDVLVTTGERNETFYALGRFPGGDGQFGTGRWAGALSASLGNEPSTTCKLHRSSYFRLSDSDSHLADMNGDGIMDLVRARRGLVVYWPGRGNGFWGTGRRDDCDENSTGTGRELVMTSPPEDLDIQETAFRLDDVNGDGLDDIVQLRSNEVDVWLNVDGTSWTERYIIKGTPANPAFASRIRLMDINGSGTRDLVWGDSGRYQYIDLAGGERPQLLVGVKNGLGKSTTIEYESSVEQMLTAERGGACEGDTASFSTGWCSKAPTTAYVVKRVTESDNLDVAGSGAGKYVTEYTYRDPVYDGRQREFRGFRRARSKRIGDANSPTDFTESTFLLGECEDETPTDGVDDCAVRERWRDNPKEALKGLPVVTERYDENGQRLSTALTVYRLRHLYSGLDGRAVRHAFQSASKSYSYDTAAGPAAAQSATFNAVELEKSYDAAFNLQARPLGTPSGIDAQSTKIVPFLHYSTSLTAVIESTAGVDFFGNQVVAIAKGCTFGGACPSAAEGFTPDEVIYKYTLPKTSSGTSKWLFRTERSYVTGSAHTKVRGDSTTSYDAFGAPTSTSAVLDDTVALHRFHDTAGRTFAAGPPTTASQNGTRVLGSREYDSFGNVTREKGPIGDATTSATKTDLLQCRDVAYDSTTGYAQLPLGESTYTGGCGNGVLLTTAGYDRGLGLVTNVTDPNNLTTKVVYDQFGRLVQLFRKSTATLPSVEISYSLPSAEDPRAYSIIHTRSQDGATDATNSYVESYSYVDGMGRARVGLTQADTEAGDEQPWIVSTVAEFDAKGAVRRKYLPFFADPNSASFPLTAAPKTGYGRQRYDAFGRQVQTFDVDGTITLQSRYHALSSDLFDAADLYPGPHQGTYASTRSDGHGRTIETTERVHVGAVIEARQVRTKYLTTGEPEVISRLRAGNAVTRWMRYDSLGRMVLNVEPHTTINFTANLDVNATPSPTGLKAWRYAYDDAGNLVGTSDARGCGQNFYYDGAGRLFAEDYSPCEALHPTYTPPAITDTSRSNPAALSSTNGIEVFYQYDASLSNGSAPPPTEDGYSSSNLKGRLASVHDRASTTWFSYDNLGRSTDTFRRITAPGTGGNAIISTRYAPRWYHKHTSYDAADRPVKETTGARSTEFLVDNGAGPESAVTTEYTKRGTVGSVGSSYGALVSRIKRGADGLVGEIEFGDVAGGVAGTTTVMKYDTRRRLASVQTMRAGTAWSSPPANYTPAPEVGAEDPPTSFQLLLQDLDYSYDVVGNPTEIRDWRTPEEWPDGSKPVSRRMEYDDLYRVTRVDYSYPGGSDKWHSPYKPELAGTTDARQPVPIGHQKLPTRAKWQTYKYDWLGNVTQSDDDLHAYYDRSLGNISHSTTKPYQLNGSSIISSPQTYGGATTLVTYDAAGNLTGMRVGRSEANCVGGECSQRFYYTWDEVGRLQQSRNVTATKDVAARYSYDANDNRVRKTIDYSTTCAVGQCFDTLYVFDSLEIRRTAWNSAAQDFPLTVDNEVAYLSAHGMRLARLVYEPAARGEPRSPSTNPVHVMLELPDHLGSASIVIDQATSELVEARTYQPYGATESDYRPDRWKGFREDYGFTGKEEDAEIGLQYFGKRYLSPYLGRWISADPLAVHAPGEADLNLYAYVSGTVLRNVDPVGLSCPKDSTCNEGAAGSQSADADRDTPEEKAREAERRAEGKAYAAGLATGFKQSQTTVRSFGEVVNGIDLRPAALKRCGEACVKYASTFAEGFNTGFGAGAPVADYVDDAANRARLGVPANLQAHPEEVEAKVAPARATPAPAPAPAPAAAPAAAPAPAAAAKSTPNAAPKPIVVTATHRQLMFTEMPRGRPAATRIAAYTKSMQEHGWQGAPIDAVEYRGEYFILNGHHRALAASRAGLTSVPVRVVPESELGAFGYKDMNEVLWAAAESGGL